MRTFLAAFSVGRVSAAGLGAAPKEQGSLPVSIPPSFFFTGSPGSRNTFFQLISERYEVKVPLGSYTLKIRDVIMVLLVKVLSVYS